MACSPSNLSSSNFEFKAVHKAYPIIGYLTYPVKVIVTELKKIREPWLNFMLQLASSFSFLNFKLPLVVCIWPLMKTSSYHVIYSLYLATGWCVSFASECCVRHKSSSVLATFTTEACNRLDKNCSASLLPNPFLDWLRLLKSWWFSEYS